MNRIHRAVAILCLLSASASAATCQTHKGFLGGSTARQPASFTASCMATDRQALSTLTANLKGYYPFDASTSDAEAYRVRDYRKGLSDAADAFDRINYAQDATGTLDSAAGRWAIFTSRDHPTRHFLAYGMLGDKNDVLYLVFLSGELSDASGTKMMPPPDMH